jgi:hypothetical protein
MLRTRKLHLSCEVLESFIIFSDSEQYTSTYGEVASIWLVAQSFNQRCFLICKHMVQKTRPLGLSVPERSASLSQKIPQQLRTALTAPSCSKFPPLSRFRQYRDDGDCDFALFSFLLIIT